jgi:hypothetical protein
MIKDFFVFFLRVILITKRDFVFIDRILFIIDILIKYLQETIISLLLFFLFLS